MVMSLIGDLVFGECFLCEVWIFVSLIYCNIVFVYDLGKYVGYLYFSMEFLFGGDFKYWFWFGICVDKVVCIIYDMVGVFVFVYFKFYIYCDIKFENMLFCVDGIVVLIDFGIVKVLEVDINVIFVGVVVGLFYYMSLE